MRANRPLSWIFLVYLTGLVCLAWLFRHALNADAVAYLRLASDYAEGKWALAISGYWGPLASWLMAPFLKLGLAPLAVARGFMVFSALVFWRGCLAVFRAFGLTPIWVLAGAVLAAVAGLYWSVQFITPDLLLAGLVSFAFSRMLTPKPFASAKNCALAGALWGLAYLAKAVALPLAALSIASFAWLEFKRGAPLKSQISNLKFQRTPDEANSGYGVPASAGKGNSDAGPAKAGTPNLGMLGRVALLCATLALVAAPWAITLSLKYGKPTFSTTPAISHALTGPPDVERYHPFARTLGPPPVGRITSWEDPSNMPYNYWSPLASRAYAWHQVKVLIRNASTCIALLTSLNVAWLALPVCLALKRLRQGQWPPSTGPLLVPLLLCLIYLPFYLSFKEHQRFFYPAYAFLLTALALWASEPRKRRREESLINEPKQAGSKLIRDSLRRPLQGRERALWWITVAGAMAPLIAAAVVIGNRPMIAGDCAVKLAARIEQAKLAGPIAGSAMLPGGRTGLYVAFLLNQPWYGDKPGATPGEFYASGARLVLVRRGSSLDAALSDAPGFTNLDAQLFPDRPAAAQCPLRVFGAWEK